MKPEIIHQHHFRSLIFFLACMALLLLKDTYSENELINILHNIHCNIIKLENINEITENLIAKYSKKYIIY